MNKYLIVSLVFLFFLLIAAYKIDSFTNSNKIKFITLSNNGYIDYTLNCLKSLEKINFDGKLETYMIGDEGHLKLKNLGYECKKLDSNIGTEFNKFRTGHWHNITKKKFDIIHENLLNNDYVCFTDGDIVYLNKEFLNYCLENIGDNDMLIQNDRLTNDKNSTICSGFMFIKSNEKTKKLFNPVEATKNAKEGWGDQTYINNIKDKLKFELLPLDLFPNGNYYYINNKKINPYMIHFNWVVGHQKKQKMKQYNKWFI